MKTITAMKYLALSFCLLAAALSISAATPPTIGQTAPDFTLSSPDGKPMQLSQMLSQNSTVLVVLRGFPGYQCPYCNRQVQDLIRNAKGFADRDARIVMVYPGPPDKLNEKANEFLTDKKLPDNFHLLLDPDYKFTTLYGLRWNAKNETAYPATFLLDHDGTIFFYKVAKEHGGRTTAAEILDALPEPKPMKSGS
jgi:peroxiredoxin